MVHGGTAGSTVKMWRLMGFVGGSLVQDLVARIGSACQAAESAVPGSCLDYTPL